MLSFRWATLGLAVALILCPTAALAVPSAADLELAKAHYRTGELNYERGAYPDAAKEFEEAYRLSSRAELLYNMGKSYDGAGDMRGALIAYRRFLATVQTSPDRPFVEKRASELNVIIARLEIAASVDGATVTIDGTRLGVTPLAPPVLEINPGVHTIEIAAEGYGTYHSNLKLERAESHKVDAQLISLVKVIRVETRAKEVPVYKRWYVWTAVGIVLVGSAVAGGVLGARKANEIDGPSLQLPVVK